MRGFLLAILSLILASCSVSGVLETRLRPAERAMIRGAVDDISRGDVVSLNKKLTPELSPKILGVFERMHAALPKPPLEVSLLGANWSIFGSVRNLHAIYQVHGKSGWAIVDATTETSEGRTVLTGIYVQPTAVEPDQINKFKLSDAGAGQFLMLAGMLAVIGLTVAALVRIWRSGLFRHRWLWTIGSLVGVMTLKMNWTTGQAAFQPANVELLSAGAFKSPVYAPWVLSVSLPLVAIIALLRRRRGGADREASAA